MADTNYAYQLGYEAYKNGQAINPYKDEEGVMTPELCRSVQWEQGFAKAADEDLEFERGIRQAFQLIEEEFGSEPEENDPLPICYLGD